MKTKTVLLIVLVVVLLIGVGSGLYVVEENEYACVVRFQKIIQTAQSAGLYFKIPFLDSI